MDSGTCAKTQRGHKVLSLTESKKSRKALKRHDLLPTEGMWTLRDWKLDEEYPSERRLHLCAIKWE